MDNQESVLRTDLYGVAEQQQSDFLTTLRKPRIEIFDVSISMFDLTGTLFISYLIARYYDLNIPLTMATSIPLGYLAHNLFSVETPLTNKLNDKIAEMKQ
jgi:hypothetical protein